MKAIRAKINKAKKENQSIVFKICVDGDLSIIADKFRIYKDIEFSKKYLLDYLKQVTNPEKIGFKYEFIEVEKLEYIRPSENLDFLKNYKIDGFDFEVTVKPYYRLDDPSILSGYDLFVTAKKDGVNIAGERLTMQRDLEKKLNYIMQLYYFNLYTNNNLIS